MKRKASDIPGLNTAKMDEYLQDATKNIESILYSSNTDGSEYYFITDAVEKLLGYNAAAILQNPRLIMRRIHPKDFTQFRKFSHSLQKGNAAVVEYRFTDAKNKEHYLRNSGFPVIKDGEVVRVDGVINDITREKTIQEELEKSEERYRLLIETANDLIFDLDHHGYFLRVNNYGALALGYKPEEMTGRHFLEFVDEDNKAEVALAFQRILKSIRVISFDVVFVDKFGKTIVFEIEGRPTKTSDKISGMLGIGRDITQRRKDEEKLRELNSKLIEANRLVSIERDRVRQQISILEEVNKLKSEFVSNISHELRTPLASIVGFAETITSDPEMEKEMMLEFSNIILSEGKRLARLINDLLDFAKMEGGKIDIQKTEFDAVELLQKVYGDYQRPAAEKGITLTANLPKSQVILFADRARIEQVYSHLLNNAVKFTDRGGRITLIAQDFDKEFEVIISDTGIGIPQKDLPIIFEKFYKAATPGTQVPGIGLGLGVVKHIIDMHKGYISVQSEFRKGTTFVVKLPKKIEING
ncbi:MAG: PAS domain S-box protein [Bacteroidota bacterium]